MVRVNIRGAGQGDRQESGRKGIWRPEGMPAFVDYQGMARAAESSARSARRWSISNRFLNRPAKWKCAGQLARRELHGGSRSRVEGPIQPQEDLRFSRLLGQQVRRQGVTWSTTATWNRAAARCRSTDEDADQRTVLIEDGIRSAICRNRKNARLMNRSRPATRLAVRVMPMCVPRLDPTLTCWQVARPRRNPRPRVKNGSTDANFEGGQVDITSGKIMMFQCTEAYKIENGKSASP